MSNHVTDHWHTLVSLVPVLISERMDFTSRTEELHPSEEVTRPAKEQLLHTVIWFVATLHTDCSNSIILACQKQSLNKSHMPLSAKLGQ